MQPVNPVVQGVLFWSAVLACAIAQFFILRTAFRPAGATDASAEPGGRPMMVPTSQRPMEILWAVLPVLLLVAAFYLAWTTMHPATPALASASG